MTSVTQPNWSNLRELIDKLNAMTADARHSLDSEPRGVLHNAYAIITHIEVCERHGVGKLVQMVSEGEPNSFPIRPANYYGGTQEFGALALRGNRGGHAEWCEVRIAREAVAKRFRQTQVEISVNLRRSTGGSHSITSLNVVYAS